jgi:hypothetical protein
MRLCTTLTATFLCFAILAMTSRTTIPRTSTTPASDAPSGTMPSSPFLARPHSKNFDISQGNVLCTNVPDTSLSAPNEVSEVGSTSSELSPPRTNAHVYPPHHSLNCTAAIEAHPTSTLNRLKRLRLNHPFPTRGKIKDLWPSRARNGFSHDALRGPTSEGNVPGSSQELSQHPSPRIQHPALVSAIDSPQQVRFQPHTTSQAWSLAERLRTGTLSHSLAYDDVPPAYSTLCVPGQEYEAEVPPETMAEQLFFYGFCTFITAVLRL